MGVVIARAPACVALAATPGGLRFPREDVLTHSAAPRFPTLGRLLSDVAQSTLLDALACDVHAAGAAAGGAAGLHAPGADGRVSIPLLLFSDATAALAAAGVPLGGRREPRVGRCRGDGRAPCRARPAPSRSRRATPRGRAGGGIARRTACRAAAQVPTLALAADAAPSP